MTDVTPIDRATRRREAKLEKLALQERERWWQGFKREVLQSLGAALDQIRREDPLLESRLLEGWALNPSFHLHSPEAMTLLAQARQDIAAVEPSGLLDASGAPLRTTDG